MPQTIGNPLPWTAPPAGAGDAPMPAGLTGRAAAGSVPAVRRLSLSDLRRALARGADDLSAFRSDVMFACLLYPVVGIVLVALTLRGGGPHLVFPFLSGFALAGPVAAVGLYEMSRRRERGEPVSWLAYLDVLRSRRVGAVLGLALFHGVIFMAWIMAANTLYGATLGPLPPESLGALLREAATTRAGWALIVSGTAVGFLFAALTLATSLVSFPMLLDRRVGIGTAIATSVRVALRNPVVVGAWGLIVAAALALGILPALLGLVIVLPLLGHATWHLYRAAVE